MGAVIIVLLSVLDYFVTPENFYKFLTYRFSCSVLMLIMYVINTKSSDKSVFNLLIISGTVIISATIELMILSFGGHQSLYYAGLILTIVFLLGVIPVPIKMSIMLVLIVYFIYLLPILIFDRITNVQTFINNNAFLIATSSTALIWRYLSQGNLIKQLELQYDIDQQKSKLEAYSVQLETLVQERTKELSISEKWHKSIFDNATDGIIILDKSGVINNVNQRACEIHGFDRDALIGISIELLDSKANKETYDDRISRILQGETLTYETEHYKKDGTKVLLEVSSKAIDIGGETYIHSFYRDITEKKKIQEQLMHSQKMESVGSLAGGIAHNFNNILTAILGYAELLLEYDKLDDTSKQRVRNIESSARKAGVMVSKLLSFARRESHEVLPLNFHDVISDSVKLFEGVLDKRIGLKISLDDRVPIIEGDPNQLEQVIMNLMVNARDAMPEGGLITIKTNFIDVERTKSNLPSYIEPGRYIALTVTDTGSGIPREIIDRIFDPFFTTKEKGKGTGLGLATVYGIVKDHKGYISVQSEVGKGTAFDIYLPFTGNQVHAVKKPEIVSIEGTENILLVDDDREVLNLLKDVLETHGYRVLPVNNSLSAIDIFKNQSANIDLVITDAVMPLMEGNELIRILRDIKPDTKIIVVSGYSDETFNKEDIQAFIRKPFERIELLATVRRVLDAGSRSSPLY